MSVNKRDWSYVNPSWFRNATTEELQEFVMALDANSIPNEEHKERLRDAFYKECNRRCGQEYESCNNGEWL